MIALFQFGMRMFEIVSTVVWNGGYVKRGIFIVDGYRKSNIGSDNLK